MLKLIMRLITNSARLVTYLVPKQMARPSKKRTSVFHTLWRFNLNVSTAKYL